MLFSSCHPLRITDVPSLCVSSHVFVISATCVAVFVLSGSNGGCGGDACGGDACGGEGATPHALTHCLAGDGDGSVGSKSARSNVFCGCFSRIVSVWSARAFSCFSFFFLSLFFCFNLFFIFLGPTRASCCFVNSSYGIERGSGHSRTSWLS